MLLIHVWKAALSVALVGGGALFAACGDDDEATPTATRTTSSTPETSAVRVDATVKDYSISISPTSAKAGEVRFFVKNEAKGVHEFVVVKSDLDPAKLPTYGANDTPAEGHAVGDVDEDKITAEGEIEDIEAGTTKDATLVLEPGKYVLICNLPAHYGLGMRVAFTVN